MKKKQPAKRDAIVLSRICKFIPDHLVSKIARKHGVDNQARTFNPWSHVVSLIYAQLTHAVGLNDVCDGLTHHATKLATIRGATPPAKNTLSHANKTRDSDMMEELFWETLKHLQATTPQGFGIRYQGLGLDQALDQHGHGKPAVAFQTLGHFEEKRIRLHHLGQLLGAHEMRTAGGDEGEILDVEW